MLWKYLAKFSLPNKIISLLKVLHANFIVKFIVDYVTESLDCVIGVKEGDGPILFTFLIAAVMITWKAFCNIPVCIFRSKMDATLTGCSYRAYGESFPVLDSEYADDTPIIFQSHANVSCRDSSIIPCFARFFILEGSPRQKSCSAQNLYLCIIIQKILMTLTSKLYTNCRSF